MAFYSALRKASSSVLPLALRSVGSRRSFHGAIAAVRSLQSSNLGSEFARRSFAPSLRFSTTSKKAADENLLSVLESEIKCGEEIEDENTVDDIPEGFPFEIEDNPGERTIFLKRTFGDETIKVEVDIPNISAEGDLEDEVDDKENGDAEESSNDSSIPLVVSVSKGNGHQLEFGITAFPDEITIDSLSIKKPESSEEPLAYEGPEFNDLDENFQKAFYSYLEVRGINPSTIGFLHEYMVSKEGKEYINWLKNLKNFVEK